MAFAGKYEFEGDENYDEFVKAIGKYVWGVSLQDYKLIKNTKVFLLKCAEINRGQGW